MGRYKAPSQEAMSDRGGKRFQGLRTKYRAACERASAVCHLCGQGIDYTIPPGEGDAFEVDHFYPVSTHPHLYEDVGNFRPSHKTCNANRGSKDVVPTLGPPSENW